MAPERPEQTGHERRDVTTAFSNRSRAEEGFLNRFALSREAPAQIRHVMDTQTPRDVSQSLPIHREESAQQSAVTEFLDPRPPAFGVASQTFQDSGHLGRDRGLAIAE